MKTFFILIFLSFFIGCENSNSIKEKQQLANQIRKKTAEQIKKEKKLSPCGSGGQMMNKIEMLALSFFCYEQIDIKKSRELLIYCSNKLEDEVNSKKEIQKYLQNYPFQYKNIEMRIFFKNSDDSTVSQGNLRAISLVDGVLEYKIEEPGTNFLKTIHRETYEEALKKIRSQATKN